MTILERWADCVLVQPTLSGNMGFEQTPVSKSQDSAKVFWEARIIWKENMTHASKSQDSA